MKAQLIDNRILHVTWAMTIGGAERSVYQLVREQRKYGFDVDLLICSASSGFYGEKVRETGATVHVLGQKTTYDNSTTVDAIRILRQYDIVHFHSAEIGLMRIAARLPSVAKFYTHRSGAFQYPLKKRIRYELVGYLLRKHFCVSSITEHARMTTSRLFRIPISAIPVTYNAIDSASLAPKRSREEVLAAMGESPSQIIRIGTSGMFRPWKRIDRLISALCPPPAKNFYCYIIGDGPALPELKSLAKNLGVTDRVKFPGATNHIGDYLQLMDIFVVPSGEGEAFGNSAVESMAVGVPTIVFADGGGLVEHIGDDVTGYIVNDVDELRERLRQLSIRPELRRRLGDAGRQHVHQKYGLAEMVTRYNNFYDFGSQGVLKQASLLTA